MCIVYNIYIYIYIMICMNQQDGGLNTMTSKEMI